MNISPASSQSSKAIPHAELRTRLAGVTLLDEWRLGRKLDGRRVDLATVERQITQAEVRLASRSAALPALAYPAELPVSQRREEIAAAIRDHQVVIVAGETGSGKTTQLPKICLGLGRGVRGMIGHTQPRRIAARTVAERVASELATPLGEAVGYQVRFTGRVGERTLVKLMTDGILLAETQHDRQLLAYDTIIVDEAHERSLNIDFLLGYLTQLLPRRPDLKLVITSATIDPQRFADHFARATRHEVPVVEVSGRTYPVEIRYRPLGESRPPMPPLWMVRRRCGTRSARSVMPWTSCAPRGPATSWCFSPGNGRSETPQTPCAGATRATAPGAASRCCRCLPGCPLASSCVCSRPHTGRRVVLATNVAETSLTVPGIKYVVDPGTARISRYSQRLKVQRLPIEPVSQASANQRTGRCGRTSDGICIRLYTELDYVSRPEFTDPEILRTNLASVILQMAALGLGDVSAFPFVEPPDRRSVHDGVTLLQELGAFDTSRRLTPLGRRLAQLPLDPRLGRMVLEAEGNGCLREVLVIAAALSIQDPRERPLEHQQAADAQHARFRDPDSDFLTLLNLWRYLQDRQRELSSNQFRRLCRTDFLNYLRIREWQDLESQLRQVVKGMGVTVPAALPDTVEAARVHISLLSGLLSHVGLREKSEYLGARGARFAIFPGSALFRKSPTWVMAAELVETSRLWARVVARIEPGWAERLAGHLIKRQYSEPHWEADQGSVMAVERVTLYGLPLVVGRKVHYGRIDPVLSRELFLRHALVEGDWRTRHEFFHANRALLDEVSELEHRARRRDIRVDDETLFAFYDARVGAEVVSGRHFDSWWKRVRAADPDLLNYEKAMLVKPGADGLERDHYPNEWRQGSLALALTYQFEPGTEADGVTVHIPLPVLNQVRPAGFDWQIPGLRGDLVTALLRSLPKATRRNFVPVPDYAAALMESLPPLPSGAALVEELAAGLRGLTGVVVARTEWDVTKVPDHLRITFRVEDESGAAVAEGKDLAAVQRQLAPQAREAVAELTEDVAREGLRAWHPGTLAKVVQRRLAGHDVTAYPALVDEADSVAVRVFESEVEQAHAMAAGTRRLLLLEVPTPVPVLSRRLSNQVKLGLTRYPYAKVPDLLEDCVSAAVDAIIARHGGPTFDDARYAALREATRAELPDTTAQIVVAVEKVVAAAHDVRSALAAARTPAAEAVH